MDKLLLPSFAHCRTLCYLKAQFEFAHNFMFLGSDTKAINVNFLIKIMILSNPTLTRTRVCVYHTQVGKVGRNIHNDRINPYPHPPPPPLLGKRRGSKSFRVTKMTHTCTTQHTDNRLENESN